MKKYIYLLIPLMVLSMMSCDKDPLGETNNPLTLECNITNEMVLKNRNPAGIDYIVDCAMRVTGRLIIEPGTTIQFNDAAYLEVVGTGVIKAKGTASDPIRFTNNGGNAPSWAGLYIETKGVGNELSHVIIEKAGAIETHLYFNNVKAGITVYGSILNLNNVIIDKSGDAGIVVLGNSTLQEFSNVKISNSKNFPIYLAASNLKEIDFNLNTFLNNGKEFIVISDVNDLGNSVREPWVINKAPIPYYLMDRTLLFAKTEINAGVEIVMAEGASIEADNKDLIFRINGTASNHVVIRGEKAQAKYWGGILLVGKSDNYRFSFLDVSDGGSRDFDWGENKANIKLGGYEKSTLELINCTSIRSGGCDIAVHEYWSYQTFINDNNSLSVCKD